MRWRNLFRPGWLALIAVVFLFAGACFTILGPWQFRQDARRDAQNTAIRESTATAPAPYQQVLPPGTDPAQRNWRQVILTGTYLPQAQALVRLRNVQGEAASEVLTPLRTTWGQTVLVNRGFVRPIGTKVPDFAAAPAGEVTVVGRIRTGETMASDRQVQQESGHRQLYAIDPAVLGAATGLQLEPGYVQLNADQPGIVAPLPLPKLESGPFFSYALQWYAFGLMAPLGLGYLLWREFKPAGPPSERDQADEPEPEVSVPAAPTATPPASNRYGSRR